MVEIAPAYGLDEEVRVKLHADAVKIAKHVGYVRTSPNANLLYNPPLQPSCGIYAETSPACVSMTGKAVNEP